MQVAMPRKGSKARKPSKPSSQGSVSSGQTSYERNSEHEKSKAKHIL